MAIVCLLLNVDADIVSTQFVGSAKTRAHVGGPSVSSKADCLHIFQPTWNVFPHCLIKFGEGSFDTLCHVMRLQMLYKFAGDEIGNTRATPGNYSLAY